MASPYPTLRLVLLRSAAVVAVSGALALASRRTLVPQAAMAAAWLLPCLALVESDPGRWPGGFPLPVAAGAVAAGYALPLLAAPGRRP